jgi:hypothetical protein
MPEQASRNAVRLNEMDLVLNTLVVAKTDEPLLDDRSDAGAKKWYRLRDLNPRPIPCKGIALPTELSLSGKNSKDSN